MPVRCAIAVCLNDEPDYAWMLRATTKHWKTKQ
jgi:hypothetical protein